MKKKNIKNEILKNKNLYPDDSIKPIEEENNETPQIFEIHKRNKYIDRKDFLKAAAGITGLAGLGVLLNSCEESEGDIQADAEGCTCHAVCTCDTECACDSDSDGGGSYTYYYTYWYPC